MIYQFDPQLHAVKESGELVAGMLKHLHRNKESPRCHSVVFEYFISDKF